MKSRILTSQSIQKSTGVIILAKIPYFFLLFSDICLFLPSPGELLDKKFTRNDLRLARHEVQSVRHDRAQKPQLSEIQRNEGEN